jgi:hypothetical protein
MIFQCHIACVLVEKHGINITSMMGFYFMLTNCVPESSVHLLLLQESHAGDLMGHFGREKMLLMLADHLYWPMMRRDVDRFVKRCIACNKLKSKLKPHGLYTPLPAPTTPWEDITMDFFIRFA